MERATDLDRYLREKTYYRFINEITSVSKHYFETCEIETDALIRAKIDMLMVGKGTGGARLGTLMKVLDGNKLHSCVTHLYNAAFCMRNPRKEENLQSMGW